MQKLYFVLELIVIIIEAWYKQAYVFFIIELCSPISVLFDEKK